MLRSWLIKIFSYFSRTKRRRRKQRLNNEGKSQAVSSMFDNNSVRLPLLKASSKQHLIAAFLNESRNCAEISPYEYTSSSLRRKRNPSLIAIDIDADYDEHRKQSVNCYSRMDKSKHKCSLIEVVDSDSSLTCSSFCSRPHKCSAQFIRKQTSDSIMFVHRHRPTATRRQYVNLNSITDDLPMSDTTINTTSSMSDTFASLNRTKEKTWRLQIHDDLKQRW